MKALILYSSRDGQTHSIAAYIANQLQDTLNCDVIESAAGREYRAWAVPTGTYRGFDTLRAFQYGITPICEASR